MLIVTHYQGSAAWLAWRRQGLGASDAAAILGISLWVTVRQLWQRRCGLIPEEEASFAMRRGLRLEPIARELYEQETGILTATLCGEHPEHSWMRASLDGVTLCGQLVLEIKAPKKESHELALSGKVPDYYLPQLQHQLAVSGALECHYVSITENKAFGASRERPRIAPPVVVRPDPAYIARLIESERQFWECVQHRRDPGDSPSWLAPCSK